MPKDIYQELKDLFNLKKSVDKILSYQQTIDKRLTSLERNIEKLHNAPSGDPAPTRKAGKKRARRRKTQRPLTDVIIQVMQKNKGPISVNELAESILKGKLFTSSAKNFKNNLRVILYRNKKDLFNLASRGMFELAEASSGKKPAIEKTRKTKASAKAKRPASKKSAKKKVAAKKIATAKKTSKKRAIKKKATARKAKKKVSAKRTSKS